MREEVLQTRAVLQSRTIFIRKWERGISKRDNFNYKAGQLLHSREVHSLGMSGKKTKELNLSIEAPQEMMKKITGKKLTIK